MNLSTDSIRVFVVHSLVVSLAFAVPTLAGADEGESESAAATNEQWVTGLASAGEQLFASTAQGLLLREGSVVAIDPSSPSKTTVAYQHPTGVWDIVATADGSQIASVDYKGNLVLFDVATAKPTLHEGAFKRWCQTLLADREGQAIIAGNEAGEILVWDIESGEVTQSKTLDGHAISDLAWSPDGATLAATDGDGHAHLLKWPSLDVVGEVQLGEEPAWCIAFVDAETCLVGSGDRNLYRVSVSDFKPTEPEPEISPEGESVADEKAGKEKTDNGKDDQQTDEPPAPRVDGVAGYKAKDWITQIAINDRGEIAIGEIGGDVQILRIDQDGNVHPTDRLESPSGVWALKWQNSQLLIGTRKNGLRTATQAWKWQDE